MRRAGWYVRRLRKMTPEEMSGRVRDRVLQHKWVTRRVRPGSGAPPPAGLRRELRGPVGLHQVARDPKPTWARAAVHSADDVLAGTWPLLGIVRDDLADPDWFRDPLTGRTAPRDVLSFSVNARDESVTGNVKQVWELSRHHHLTQLAAAYWVTGDEQYAEAVDRQLRSWWAQNPFLSGIHWTGGIELGIRLVSWVWIRRLLADWPKVADLFEHNEDCRRQVRWHQEYLVAFHSEGSSGNNHAIAEDVGLLVASCGLPWFVESEAWGGIASARLRRHLADNTAEDGVNRELATDYHRFVTELLLVAAVEARAVGRDLGDQVWRTLAAGLDAAAAMVDVRGRPPRQGDGDEGRALVVDGCLDAWAVLLSAGAATIGALGWWPSTQTTLAGQLLGALADRPPVHDGRPASRPRSFPASGIAVLRTPEHERPEIWCRCDGGPHGFSSIAAHAHADALSVEVRHDGVDILADPGTYCYHGEPEWRRYFRSTRAHNTVRIDGRDQSVSGGPFLWMRHARTQPLRDEVTPQGEQIWSAEHDGYRKLPGGSVRHQRVVRLRPDRALVIVDVLAARGGHHELELLLHLGPDITAELDGDDALLTWPIAGTVRDATLRLPRQLTWTAHCGESAPPLGWYSPRFGQRVPSTTLVGTARMHGSVELRTELRFRDDAPPALPVERELR